MALHKIFTWRFWSYFEDPTCFWMANICQKLSYKHIELWITLCFFNLSNFYTDVRCEIWEFRGFVNKLFLKIPFKKKLNLPQRIVFCNKKPKLQRGRQVRPKVCFEWSLILERIKKQFEKRLKTALYNIYSTSTYFFVKLPNMTFE